MYAGIGDAFGDAKAKWEGVAGRMYTGNASGAEQMLAAYSQLVRIANGDLIAALDAFKGTDPAMQPIGRDYLQRAAQSSEGNFIQLVQQGIITPALYQTFKGVALNSEPWWKYQRENQVAAAIFPYLGAGSGSGGGYAQNLPLGFRYSAQNIYDYDFDFAALVNAARAFAQAHPPEAPPSPEAIQQVTTNAAPTPVNPNTPPPGWRAATYQGQQGFFGPDGLFYRGLRPWEGGGSGVSVNPTATPSNTPPNPSTTPPPGSPGPTTPNPTAPPPVTSNPNGTQNQPPANPASDPPASNPWGDEDSGPAAAGFGGKSAAILIGGTVLAYLLFGRKR